MASAMPVTLKVVEEAHDRIKSRIRNTPIFTSSMADEISGRQLFFKAENMQMTGSFKARGALNAILALKQRNPDVPGVVTHSSGNHGQALAWASGIAGLPCSVVVPLNCPQVKRQGIRQYGAWLFECGRDRAERCEACKKIAAEKGYYVIPPSDHADVIAAQGTIALEVLEEVPDLDAFLVSVSGGGMIAGIAIAAKAKNPNIRIFAVEPEGKMLEKCLTSGQRLWPELPQRIDTLADGMTAQQVDHVTFPILCELVERQVFTVNNDDIVKGMKFAFQDMKLVVEASAGAAVAAALSQKLKELEPPVRKVCVILCGGNVDIDKLPWY